MNVQQAKVPAERIASVRAFNRFYTELIGILREGLVDTPYSLTEARVMFELSERDSMEVSEIRRTLNIDPGYLSRILARFRADGLTRTEKSSIDARRQVIRLTSRGRKAYKLLDNRSAAQVSSLLEQLTDEEQRRLIDGMQVIRNVLEKPARPDAYVLRSLRAGDLGWVVHRHGVIYAEEYGFNENFEALVAQIVAEYVQHHDPKRESAWIAEIDGEPVGSVFCTRKDERTAQLRLLLVEPRARGLGIGSRLVTECLRFAEHAGYDSIILWTNNLLDDARRVYEKSGFVMVDEAPHEKFGRANIAQFWAREFATDRRTSAANRSRANAGSA